MTRLRLIAPIAAVLAPLWALAFATPARAAEPDLRLEPTTTSRLVTIKLPDGGARIGNPAPLAELVRALKTLASEGGMTLGQTESILWGGSGHTQSRADEVKTLLAERLKKDGYNYEVAGEKKTDQGLVTVFMTAQPGKGKAVLGTWTAGESFLLLAWGGVTPKNGAQAPTQPAQPEKPVRTAQPASAGSSPGALTGQWGFTSISGTTYWDKSTGAYLGSGTGGSQSYTFLGNGRYKMFNYIKTRQYNWEIQALTWEDGTVSVSGDTLVFTPTSGKYQVIDSAVAKNNYTRPMTAEELKKNAKRKPWSITRDERTGKPVLVIDKVQYKRIEE